MAKFDPSGALLKYSAFFGGVYNDDGYDIAVDVSGRARVAGKTETPVISEQAAPLPGALSVEWRLSYAVGHCCVPCRIRNTAPGLRLPRKQR